MQKILFLLPFLLSTCISSTTSPNSKKNPNPSHLSGKIISIKDGDSLELLDANNDIHQIRLAHVDCPENKQAFGKRAKIFTANFCFGKEVTVITTDTDRYGRIVGIVEVEGKELNLAIIQAGMGWHFKKYSKSESHAKAELKARKKKVGIWTQGQPIPPWEYRKRS